MLFKDFFFGKKAENGLMVDNLLRFNIKSVFRTCDYPQRVPLRVKYCYSIECVRKTKFHLKIMKFVTNSEESVLGS